MQVGCDLGQIRSSIEVVITGTTGNRVYPKRVPRVQIPPAPPENKKQMRKHLLFIFNEICLTASEVHLTVYEVASL